MRILGIDPGYAIMGYGILDYNGNRFRTVDYGSIETEAHTPMPQRLNQLFDGLNEVIQKYQPEEASIEELFFNSNTTTAIKVGEARGVAFWRVSGTDFVFRSTRRCRLSRRWWATAGRRKNRCRIWSR